MLDNIIGDERDVGDMPVSDFDGGFAERRLDGRGILTEMTGNVAQGREEDVLSINARPLQPTSPQQTISSRC